MDVFYEESAINANASKNEIKYRILHVGTVIFLTLGIISLVLAIFTIPGTIVGGTDTQAGYMKIDLDLLPSHLLFWGVNLVFFWLSWFLLSRVKRNINVSYDYTFVSGEIRITKVFNVNKRKKVDKIGCDEILQIGDTDNPSYARLASAPQTKTIVCTSNSEPAEGKFFMYILVGGETKYLYVLECRELLLMQILKFARRSVLESDYVMQEKKQKKTTV